MRRVRNYEDQGIATILVVLMMPLLVLFSALVFDGGRGVLARRQTQNAADAGALAKATDCARSISGTSFTPYETNGAVLANAPTCGAGTTTVSMTKSISFMFRPGGGNADVTRSATANWGTLGGASTLPIAISSCEFTQALLAGTTDIIIYLDDTKPQSGCSSLPGGFSQLEASANFCYGVIIAGGFVDGQTGAPDPNLDDCITNPDPNAAPLPYRVLIPMYDSSLCQTSNCTGAGPYKIVGFASFVVSGYSFTGNRYGGTLGNKCPDDKNRGNYCIKGDFIEFVQTQGTGGPSTDFGTRVVYLAS